jgi:hypothetical protein
MGAKIRPPQDDASCAADRSPIHTASRAAPAVSALRQPCATNSLDFAWHSARRCDPSDAHTVRSLSSHLDSMMMSDFLHPGALSPFITPAFFSPTNKRRMQARLPGMACCDNHIVPVPGRALKSCQPHACTLIVPHLTGSSIV